MNYNIVVKNIRAELTEYLNRHKLKSLVCGISGGIDSAVCVALAKPVCDALGVKIIGRSISIGTNTRAEEIRADMIGHSFCHDYKHINAGPEYQFLKQEIDKEGTLPEDDGANTKANKIRYGNLKARIRMFKLYNLSQLHNGMVLSTDNFTEYMLGFSTLHGDVGDYGMIQYMWKTEVYGLANYIADNELSSDADKEALRSCIKAIPTDGLGITNSDLDQLGVDSYDECDDIFKRFLSLGVYDDGCPIVSRHLRTQFKRDNPFNLTRETIIRGAL